MGRKAGGGNRGPTAQTIEVCAASLASEKASGMSQKSTGETRAQEAEKQYKVWLLETAVLKRGPDATEQLDLKVGVARIHDVAQSHGSCGGIDVLVGNGSSIALDTSGGDFSPRNGARPQAVILQLAHW